MRLLALHRKHRKPENPLAKHLQYRHDNFDESVLENIQSHESMEEFVETPEIDEIKAVIKKIKYGQKPA